MRINKTKAKLAENQVVLGAAIHMPSPDLVELSAALGFDFVFFDTEHEPMSIEQIVHMIRAADAFDITPVVRMAKDPDQILLCLDAGAQGIHVPRCNSAADVRELVEWTRFHPQGKRTFYALGRSANYGIGVNDEEWSQAANRELWLTAQVEEIEAVNHLDEILAVPHVDVIRIGPQDLWQSMGMPDRKVVDEVIAQITTRVVAAGKHVSLTVRNATNPAEFMAPHLRRGVRVFTVSPLEFVRHGGLAYIREARQAAAAI